MLTKTPIEVALDVRSYERIAVISDYAVLEADSRTWHKTEWLYPHGPVEAASMINPDTVVIVEGTILTRKVIQIVGEAGARLIAVRPVSDDHARSVRKMLTSLYPWSETWTISTDAGRFIVAKGAVGHIYDRDSVVDMRTGAAA